MFFKRQLICNNYNVLSIFKDVEVHDDDKNEVNVPMKRIGIVVFSNYVVETHKRLQGYMNDKHHVVHLGDCLFVLHHSFFFFEKVFLLDNCGVFSLNVL